MRAFSPQDQWKKHISVPILAMSEGLVAGTAGRLLGLLGLLLATVVTARLLLAPGAGLLASGTTAAMSSLATPSGGDGSDKGGVFFHCLVKGGHHVGLLAVHGPQLVSLGDEQPHILIVIFSQHDAQL